MRPQLFASRSPVYPAWQTAPVGWERVADMPHQHRVAIPGGKSRALEVTDAAAQSTYFPVCGPTPDGLAQVQRGNVKRHVLAEISLTSGLLGQGCDCAGGCPG